MPANIMRKSPFRLYGLMGVLMAGVLMVFFHSELSWNWLVSWVAGVSIATFVFFGIDKRKAQRGLVRIPEDVMLGLALTGGSPGALIGIVIFRHKISKRSFLNAFWTIVLIQAVGACVWYFLIR